MVTTVKNMSLCAFVIRLATTGSISLGSRLMGRRSVLSIAHGAASSAAFGAVLTEPACASTSANAILDRFDSQLLTIPPVSQASELNGVDNLYFPQYLAGEWSVTQTLVQASTPLGLRFAGGPNGLESIAEESMSETKKQINKPVQLRLRYVPTKWGVAEDRTFNTRQRLDAFAGKSVVASVDYANVGGSNRASVLAMGGTENDPLQTTIVRFRGPAAQKTFVTSHGAAELENDTWVGYELDRSIFALTNQNTAPPVTTDTELIWKFEKINEDFVRAKLRIAGYLNAQNDKLYFDARNKAVSLQDYTLEMQRVST